MRWAEDDNAPVWILWIGSSITAIIPFIFSFCLNDKFGKSGSFIRGVGMIIAECLICGGLVALMLSVDFSSI
jgi:hypothetical protein